MTTSKESFNCLLSQDDKAFHDGRQRNIVLCGQFGTFSVSQKDGRRVRLKAGDCFRFARLTDHVDSLADSNGNGQWPQFLVERDEHPWLQRCRQCVQQVMRFAQNNYNTKRKANWK